MREMFFRMWRWATCIAEERFAPLCCFAQTPWSCRQALAGLRAKGKKYFQWGDFLLCFVWGFLLGEVCRGDGSWCGFHEEPRCGHECKSAWFPSGRGLTFLECSGCPLRRGACGWRSCGGRGGRTRVCRCRSGGGVF